MEINLNQSSCEVNIGMKNIEIHSETEISKSQEEEAGDNAEITTSESSGSSSGDELPESIQKNSRDSPVMTTDYLVPEQFKEKYSEITSEPEIKKRKRKRKHKKKSQRTTTAYESPEPFMKRYKTKDVNIKSISVPPKFHLRFDDDGNPDQKKSKFNLRPRIVKAFKENLKLQNPEFIKPEKLSITPPMTALENEKKIEVKPCLKPRIVKATLIK